MLHTRWAAELRTTTGFLVCKFVRSYPKKKSAVWVHVIHSCYVTAWICKFAEHHTFTLTFPFISPNPACPSQAYSVGVWTADTDLNNYMRRLTSELKWRSWTGSVGIWNSIFAFFETFEVFVGPCWSTDLMDPRHLPPVSWFWSPKTLRKGLLYSSLFRLL